MGDAEWNCLKIIERMSGGLTDADVSQATMERLCKGGTLDRLRSKGLVERVPDLWMPLEMQHFKYRLTDTGKALLEASRNQ